MKEGQTQEPVKVFIADFKNKVLREKYSLDKEEFELMLRRKHGNFWNDYYRENEEKYIASLKQYPATWLTAEMDGKEFVEGVDFHITHNHPMGMVRGQEQYSAIMKQSYGTAAVPLPQEPVGGMKETFEDYMRNARNAFVKTITDYFPHEGYQRYGEGGNKIRVAAEDILICFDQMREMLLPPPPAPIKTEGEDEINLLKETINNQHALILSAEQRGYEKAKQEFSAPPSPDVEALAEKYANGIIPNPNSKDAPYYTTGDKWDDIFEAFKAGYSSSLPQSSKTFYCWHKEATGEDACKQQCKDCSGCKGSEEISNIIPQSSNLKEGDFITGDFPYKESKSSTEEEKGLWNTALNFYQGEYVLKSDVTKEEVISELMHTYKISKR